MAKKDFRLYCEEEYIDHLKMVADEKGTSVNQLVLSVLTKKYPMPKRKKDQTSTGPTLDINPNHERTEPRSFLSFWIAAVITNKLKRTVLQNGPQ